jgi:hypothetical protein
MTLGLAGRQGRLGNVAVVRCEAQLPERSIYRLLHAERDRLFPDELFSDLDVKHGRRSVRRRSGGGDGAAAAGGLLGPESLRPLLLRPALAVRRRGRRRGGGVCPYGAGGAAGAAARLLGSGSGLPGDDRAGPGGGAGGVRRVLDSAPLHDAVATQDTVTLLRGAIRGCCAPARPSWPPPSAQRCAVTTTTPPRASRSATGTTRRPASGWWMRCSAPATVPCTPCVASSLAPRSPGPPSCWPR